MLWIDNNIKRRAFSLIGLLIPVLALAIVYGEELGAPLSSEEVKALIPTIEAAEKSINNLKVDAESWVEEKASASALWQRTPIYVSCTAWMKRNSKDKIRVEVHKENLKWTDGTAPYLDRNYSISFDGINTKYIEYSTGYSGKTFPKKEGQILPGIPEWVMNNTMGSSVGLRFTTNFFFSNEKENMSFSKAFRLAISPEAQTEKSVQFEFAFEEKDGGLYLKFGTKPANWGRETWWFDPNRGFALINFLHTNTDKNGIEHIVSDIRVNKLQEVAPGIWWPMEVFVESEPRDPNATYKRTVYRALNVVVNDPNFNENIFNVPFPKGYRVEDKITGKKYIVDTNLALIPEPNNPHGTSPPK
jgi:hypothetical protein